MLLTPAALQPPVRLSASSDEGPVGEGGYGYDPSAEYRRLLQLTAPAAARRQRSGAGSGAGAGAAALEAPRTLKMGGGGGGGSALAGASDAADAYQQLMARERRVLDTVDRIVNDAERGATERDAGGPAAALVRGDMPAQEVVMRTAGSVRLLFEDLVACRSLDDARRAVLGVDRSQRPFLGIALMALAALLAMLLVAAGGA